MKNYICENCSWEDNELKTIMVPNESNPKDKTLYEKQVCPDCESDQIIETDEIEIKITGSGEINKIIATLEILTLAIKAHDFQKNGDFTFENRTIHCELHL